eukprot:CAMPEP_0202712632 /NCGR_PEP_ID=MMETSP1385-20130828/43551_1 /ASSEMBLY_ACC=CAM_ASM_000861 /TAXON_ID=933848 /ORGANISM="Elphidium margaritaceum" /LENGTH=194 /DNA_ID=CAMNT_0049372721 /DNA_START=36 /DNA_END=617 /DNA_ORIENTATION=-
MAEEGQHGAASAPYDAPPSYNAAVAAADPVTQPPPSYNASQPYTNATTSNEGVWANPSAGGGGGNVVNPAVQVVQVVVVPDNNAVNLDNLPLAEAWRATLRARQVWCCSYYVNLQIFLFIIMALSAYNAWSNFYYSWWGALVFVSAVVYAVGVAIAAFGLYGLYYCVPAAFLCVALYLVCYALIGLALVITYAW